MTKFVGQVTKFVTRGKGTYCLIFSVEGVTFRTGRGREFAVPAGNYIYVGSAFGSGGLRARVGRHLKRGKRPHWHIDYLTNHESFELIDVKTFEGLRIECEIASLLSSFLPSVKGFGCTDCRCPSHLFRLPDSSLTGGNPLPVILVY